MLLITLATAQTNSMLPTSNLKVVSTRSPMAMQKSKHQIEPVQDVPGIQKVVPFNAQPHPFATTGLKTYKFRGFLQDIPQHKEKKRRLEGFVASEMDSEISDRLSLLFFFFFFFLLLLLLLVLLLLLLLLVVVVVVVVVVVSCEI